LSELPPPVTESQFRDLEGATKDQVKKRATPFVRDLHAFLNEGSCLGDIQRIRRRWKPQIRSSLAFEGDDFPTEREHWYTYNTGGRNEAQFNIGLFPDYLRFGLGFEFTKKVYGEPESVGPVFGQFCDILRQHRQAFDRFAQDNSFWVEWLPEGKTGRINLGHVRTHDVSKWLLHPKVSDWIFVGRLLYRKDDANTLKDPTRLKQAMESVFVDLKPLWEQAQLKATQTP